MEAVRKAASGAVETIRNSPLFRRKFGTYQKAGSHSSDEEERPISPEKDRTPFVQGIYFQVEFLGKHGVDNTRAQDHGCTDEAITLLWEDKKVSIEAQLCTRRDSRVQNVATMKAFVSCNAHSVSKATVVSLRVSTTNLRVKTISDGTVLFDFPLFRVTYCGTDKKHKEAFSFVAKELDGNFYCYVFRCATKDKAYTMALTLAKAFYLAYQILQEQQGEFPPTPERETVFEPQLPDDTKISPHRPPISPMLERHPLEERHSRADRDDLMEFTDQGATPNVRVTRPSVTTSTSDSDSIVAASADDDFTRLAKARSNPDILRSTLEHHAITGDYHLDLVRLHADPGSLATTPAGSPKASPHTTPQGSQEDLRDV